MESAQQKQLERAKEYFYSWRLLDAYNILRRFFDRLPFRPQTEHAELIGIFVRCLAELGKERELEFYTAELERIYSESRNSSIGYQLAVVYLFGDKNRDRCRELLEDVVKRAETKELLAKAKIMLADYYADKNDLASCRSLIFSIESPEDPTLLLLWEIWKAKVLRDEKRYEESEFDLKSVLARVTPQTNWYVYLSAQVVLAIQYLRQERIDEATSLILEVKHLFDGRQFKSVQTQIEWLEKQIQQKGQLEPVRFRFEREGGSVVYGRKSFRICEDSSTDRLLLLFTRNKTVDKEAIVKALYGREYNAKRDDKLIYYHVHALRKRLKLIGLPSEAIQSDKEGYRFIPEIELSGGQF